MEANSNEQKDKNGKIKKVKRKYTKIYQCPICNEVYMNKPSFEEHNSIHHSDKPFACLFCDYRSTLRDIMRNHIHIQHGILMKRSEIFTEDVLELVARNKFKCTVCAKLFSTKNTLLQHHVVSKGCKPFRCSHCEKINLKNQDNDNKDFPKEDIKQSITNINYSNIKNEQNTLIENPVLTNITIKEEDLTDEMESCDIENPLGLLTPEHVFDDAEIYSNTLELLNEELVDEEVELCDIENTSYEDTDNKRKSDQIYKCRICNQQFLNKATLHSHSMSHCGSKPFGCPHCDYRCTLRGIMKNHIEIRHGISMKIIDIVPDRKHKLYTRAFLCKACNKIFPSKQRLHNHRLLNNDCKPYKCSYCEYRCLMKTTMKRHIIGRHGKNINCSEIYPCITSVIKKATAPNIENRTNNESDFSDIKLEVDATKILPELSIKQEDLDDTEFDEIESKYDVNSDTLFNENEINSFENDHLHYTLKYDPDDEDIFLNIKEEVVTEEIKEEELCG